MKPGDHINVVTEVGPISGVLRGWDVNGIKIFAEDCADIWVQWVGIKHLVSTSP